MDIKEKEDNNKSTYTMDFGRYFQDQKNGRNSGYM
jgi:hypothetical protein